MILRMTEKPPRVLFGWTVGCSSRSITLAGVRWDMAKGVRGVFFLQLLVDLQHLLHILLLLRLWFSLLLAPSLLLLVSLFFWCFFFTWPSSPLLLLLLHLLLLFFLLLTALLLLFILPLDITVQFYRLTPPSPLGNKPLYQARESSLVPLRLLTVHFLQKM